VGSELQLCVTSYELRIAEQKIELKKCSKVSIYLRLSFKSI